MKKQKKYTELMTSKNKMYDCYACNTKSVAWNRTKFICSKCKAIHESEGHK